MRILVELACIIEVDADSNKPGRGRIVLHQRKQPKTVNRLFQLGPARLDCSGWLYDISICDGWPTSYDFGQFRRSMKLRAASPQWGLRAIFLWGREKTGFWRQQTCRLHDDSVAIAAERKVGTETDTRVLRGVRPTSVVNS